MRKENENTIGSPIFNRIKYYIKLLFYILVLGCGFSSVIKLAGFLLMIATSDTTYRDFHYYLQHINISDLFLDAIFIPITYYTTVRLLRYINERNEL